MWCNILFIGVIWINVMFIVKIILIIKEVIVNGIEINIVVFIIG